MTREAMLTLFDAGDFDALLRAVGREWLEKNNPGSRWATVLADRGEGIPCDRLVITPSVAA